MQVPYSLAHAADWHYAHPLCTDGYYLDYPRDRLYLKAIVYSLCAVETIQAGVLLFETFASFASGSVVPFNNPYLVGVSAALFPSVGAFRFRSLQRLSLLQVGLTKMPVSVITQASYAYRIYVLSHSRWLAGVVVLVRSCPRRKVVQNVTFALSVIGDSVCHGDSDGGFLHSDAYDENYGSYASGYLPSHVGVFLACVYAGDR